MRTETEVPEEVLPALLALATRRGRGDISESEWWTRRTELIGAAKQERRRVELGLAPDRRSRQMPSMLAIARHLDIEDEDAACWKCGDVPGDGNWDGDHQLQRAHIIDRVFHGLDNEANLRPLCIMCHRSQPIFKAGDEQEALDWFNQPGDPLWQFILSKAGEWGYQV